MESKYQSEIHKLIDELELKNDIELSELEERKNKYIHTLTSRHEAAFADIKTYYNKITDDNLNVISKLKVNHLFVFIYFLKIIFIYLIST